MSLLFVSLGWCLLLIAGVFALGLWMPLGRHLYPSAPGLLRRLAAPFLFALLSGACFLGHGFSVMLGTAVMGTALAVLNRRNRRKRDSAQRVLEPLHIQRR